MFLRKILFSGVNFIKNEVIKVMGKSDGTRTPAKNKSPDLTESAAAFGFINKNIVNAKQIRNSTAFLTNSEVTRIIYMKRE